MRRITAISVFSISQLTWASLGLAQQSGASSTTVQVPSVGATKAVSEVTTTTTQPAVEVAPPPPTSPIIDSGGTESTTYVNRPLLVTGLVLFAGTFGTSVGVAAENNRPSDNPNLYIPVAGPWMDLAQRDCSVAHPCVGEPGNKALLILDGIGQGLGVVAIVTSFFVPEKKSRHWFFVGSDTVHVTPTALFTGYGMAAVGRF
jgi:hypothetical protein